MGSSIFVLGEGTSLTLERLQAQRFCDLSCNWWGDYQYVIKPSELQLTGRERDMLWDLEFGVKTPKTPLQQSFIMHAITPHGRMYSSVEVTKILLYRSLARWE